MNFVVNGYNIIEIVLFTFLVSLVLVQISKKIAKHLGAMDVPNARKIHTKPMPSLGGLGIYGAFVFGYIMYGSITSQMLSILFGSFLILLIGLFDDIKPIRAKYKFLVQLVAASIVVFYGRLFFDEITILGLNLVFPTIINQLIAVFFIVGSINAINLIDGLDGLCAGISTIYFITVAIIAFILNQLEGLDTILCLIMIGSTLGFLVHNFPPAKTFMGDCGSTFLGFMIAIIALLGFKVTTITSLFIPIIILAIPIFDTLFAIFRRLLKHEKIGEPDREHLHHQLLKMRFSPRITVLIIYIINILFSAVSILFVLGDNKVAMIIYVILMLLLLYVVINTDILFEHKKKGKNKREAKKA